MSDTSARELVKRLKDDQDFRKSLGSKEFSEAWQMIEEEGYVCSPEEIQKAYNTYGCGITGPRSAWREAVKKICRLPIHYPGSPIKRDL